MADGPGSRVGLIDRHDLVATLDLAARRRVTIISAPAGSGKTSLLRAWADWARKERPIAFVSVRSGRHDAQLFWLDLVGEIRGALNKAAEPPHATPGFDGGAMMNRVLTELAETDDPITLVIDDLHELDSTEAIEQLTSLLTRLPRHAHAVLATRRDLPLRLHRLRLTGDLAEIRGPQLRFAETETRALLAASGLELPDHLTATLQQRTEGWAAGLRLAALSLAGHPDPERFVAEFSGSDRTVAEYLTAEMLERQPKDVQRLLLRTSVLDRVNGELADLLTGSIGSERILLELEDANAFVVSLDPERTWFRYHHLFGGLLRLELRRTQPEELPELHRLAARWLVGRTRIADAIEHLQAAGDWSEAAHLLTDHALSLTLDGQADTVQALLDSFPARTYENELALAHATADLNRLRLDEASAHLEMARTHARTAPPDRGNRLTMAIASLELLLARLRGHFDGVFELVDSLPSPATGRSDADIALGSDLRAVALLNLGVTEAWLLRLSDSERHLTEGAALARAIERPYLEIACLAHLGFSATVHSFGLARRRCEEAIAVATRQGWDELPVIVPALATLAGAKIWTGEFDDGARWLERATEAGRSGAEPGIRLLLHLVAGVLHAARGRNDLALEEFDAATRVNALMVGEHALTARVASWTIATQARLGLLEEARAGLAMVTDRQLARGELCNAIATLRLAEHDPVAAQKALQPVLEGTAPVNPHLTLIEAHLLDALAHHELGEQSAAGAAVERALSLAEPDRLVLPFAMTGAWRLLETVLTGGTAGNAHSAQITGILNAVHGHADADRDRAEPLSPSELRVLRYLPSNLTRQEIANEMTVSLNTVSTHIRNIYAKLGVTDRSAAVQRGRELRLLPGGRA
ncbi:LuxR C-terminal-related transcriptional regulator [Streptomyces sp. NBC_00038]|uniref:LuxR C-terminal-related transcriptional regulator n=1 Tax=Streptomyces sp. NBC_00038 TaxID=2903615 RepID=UPI00225B0405|nr:LuxR C-terminal-related transcriptional regulator [Streptomyces sp. NBC_00038]MCX5562408.1 LuxR C-terminal-related transcriptional regulator [Streptomyces sp. NBC_00038]